ncbi:MAG TPA: UDP-3-O-(3-hydroxymyristoyl)glucosamine N-acyltransferase [Methylomirabilota bacterium]|nr:UDP-3-O-(3-hydroxymyristoyl)glucosamine N-acyltransferase [Methylomirabilota bacterium]
MEHTPGFTLGELAAALGLTLEGDAMRSVTGVAALEAAGPDDITFVTDARHRDSALASRAGAFLAPPDLVGLPGPVLRATAPRLVLADLLAMFHPPAAAPPGVAPSAIIGAGARVAATASVGAFAVVEAGAVIGERVRVHALAYVGAGAEIGEDSVLHPHVVVRERVRIGRRVIVHAGAVLGADGFGYAFDGARHRKIPQVGGVRIEDDVEIGANTTIDRATLGETVVRRGTKIDNLVMVAHNVDIGEDCIVAAQSGIAGSSRIGRGVIMLGQAGVADHVTIGEGAILAAKTGVSQDVPAGEKVFGTWARPIVQARRIWIAEADLPEMVRRVRTLERRLADLEARLEKEGGRP